MKQNAIGWFDIFVSDMERAMAFYQVVFNMELVELNDPTSSEVIMQSFPTDMAIYGAGGALVKREGASPGVGGTVVYFGTEDCLAEESRAIASGGQVIKPKMSIGEFGFVSLCMDTEGNMFGLSSMK